MPHGLRWMSGAAPQPLELLWRPVQALPLSLWRQLPEVVGQMGAMDG